jgi:hypothetical protein
VYLDQRIYNDEPLGEILFSENALYELRGLPAFLGWASWNRARECESLAFVSWLNIQEVRSLRDEYINREGHTPDDPELCLAMIPAVRRCLQRVGKEPILLLGRE